MLGSIDGPTLLLVRGDATARKSSQGCSEQDIHSRWGPRKQNSVVSNERTLKTNKSAIKAFCSWLTEVHNLESAPEALAMTSSSSCCQPL